MRNAKKPVASDEKDDEEGNYNDDDDDDDGDVRRAEEGWRGREVVSKILTVFLQVRNNNNVKIHNLKLTWILIHNNSFIFG